MKKTNCLILAFLMVLNISLYSSISAFAATSHTQAEAVSWVNSQIGKTIEYNDSANYAQCVDFIQAYYNYLGNTPNYGSAYTYASCSLPSGWQRINNYSGFKPSAGDIGVWSGVNHVGIFTSSSVFVDQNSNGRSYVASNSSLASVGLSLDSMTCVIRPDFKSGAKGVMTVPKISINRMYYYVGDTINISWNKTASGTDFYQYWLIIKNKTTNKEKYAGATGAAGDVSKNSYSYKISESGTYLITVYAVPYNDKNTRQKVETKEFIANKTEMIMPNIKLDKSKYTLGDTVKVSWDITSGATDFYQYWVVVKNTTTGKNYKSGATGDAGDPSKNSYTFKIEDEGAFSIDVYSVPYYNKSSRQKVAKTSFITSSNNITDMAISLSKNSYVYNGNAKKPTVTVNDAKGNELIKNTDYTVKYQKGRKDVGRYAVKIVGKGKYSGEATVYFKIKPKSTTIKSLSGKKNAFKIIFNKQTTQTTGYQIQYSLNSSFEEKQTVNVTKNTKTSATIKKLKSKKKYYVRIRTYKTVNGKKYYSAWSAKKTVTIKK